MISPLGAVALFAIAWLTAHGRPALSEVEGPALSEVEGRLPGWKVAGLSLAVLVAVSAVLPDPRGLRARHYANPDFADPIEYSTEFRATDYTRIDRTLDFTPEQHEVPRYWINDLERFNFQGGAQPNRELLPFSVQWDAYWWVDTPGDVLGLYLDAPGGAGELVIDGVKVLTMTAEDGTRTASATPLRGWHQVVVRVSLPGTASGRISAGRLINNERVPFDAAFVAQKRLATWQRTGYRAIDVAWALVTYGILTWLAALIVLDLGRLWTIYRANGPSIANRPVVIRIVALIAIVESFWFAGAWMGRVMILPGGDDTLTYEWYARHIQTDSVWMPHLQEPFFYQVLYPYFLAGVHGVFGEDMFGVMLLQRLFVWFIAWAIMHIATRLYRDSIWREALVWGLVFSFWKAAPIFAKPLNESLFIPLLVAWTISLMAAMKAPATSAAVRTGVLAGIAALTRTTALLAIAASLPSTWSAWKPTSAKATVGEPSRNRATLTAMMLSAVVVIVSFISIRNAVVTGTFKPLPGEFGVTLAGGNEPPPGVAVDLNKSGTERVIDYARKAPGPFLQNMWNKALFAFGYYEPYAPGFGSSFLFMVSSLAGFIGLWLVMRAKHIPVGTAVLPALIAFSQFAAVVIIYPKNERLILPFHVMFTPYAAIAIERLWAEFKSR